MDAAQFKLPVRLKMANDDVREIYSAEEALDLLFGWPQQKGRVFDKACAECLVATIEPGRTEAAQRAFTAFARVSGILDRDICHGPGDGHAGKAVTRH